MWTRSRGFCDCNFLGIKRWQMDCSHCACPCPCPCPCPLLLGLLAAAVTLLARLSCCDLQAALLHVFLSPFSCAAPAASLLCALIAPGRDCDMMCDWLVYHMPGQKKSVKFIVSKTVFIVYGIRSYWMCTILHMIEIDGMICDMGSVKDHFCLH